MERRRKYRDYKLKRKANGQSGKPVIGERKCGHNGQKKGFNRLERYCSNCNTKSKSIVSLVNNKEEFAKLEQQPLLY